MRRVLVALSLASSIGCSSGSGAEGASPPSGSDSTATTDAAAGGFRTLATCETSIADERRRRHLCDGRGLADARGARGAVHPHRGAGARGAVHLDLDLPIDDVHDPVLRHVALRVRRAFAPRSR